MIYVAKIENGNVNLYNANTGGYHLLIPSAQSGSPIVNAVVQGETVVVTYANGRTAIHDAKTGSFERLI